MVYLNEKTPFLSWIFDLWMYDDVRTHTRLQKVSEQWVGRNSAIYIFKLFI